MDRLTEAAHRAENQGASIILGRHQIDNMARTDFNRYLDNPSSYFTQAQQLILNAPAPPYSTTERRQDEAYETYLCPLLQSVPETDDMVIWRGKYYSHSALSLFHEQPMPRNGRQDPLTREIMSQNEFQHGDQRITLQESIEVNRLIRGYNQREQRRTARLEYDRMHERLRELQNLANARLRTRAIVRAEGGSTVGSPIENNIRRRPVNDSEGLQLLGANDNSSSDEEVFILGRNRQQGRQDRVARVLNNNRSINNSRQLNVQNPLEEERHEHINLPQNLWGEPNVENATTNFLSLCENEGWENNLHRHKTQFLNERTPSLFQVGGPFEL